MPSLIPLTDISEYNIDTETSLRMYYSPNHPAYPTRFTGYLPSEVISELDERLSETQSRSILVILARIEAAFQIDYKVRAKSKGSDPISMSFRKLYALKGDRASFEYEILKVWRNYIDPENCRLINRLGGMIKYRHWLAHGRHWQYSSNYTYTDVYLMADVILAGFDLQS